MADTKISALTAATVAAVTNEFAINEAGTSKKLTLQQIADFLVKRAAAATVAAGEYTTQLVLASNSANITGLTLTTVMSITAIPIGRYYFKCQLIYQTTALTTGIGVAVNFTNALTQFVVERRFSDVSATASTNAPTEINVLAAGGVYSSQGTRLKNSLIGAVSASVDTANADMIANIEGFFVASASGDLEIKLEAETTALVCRAMQGSYLELIKLS